ncbi:class III lanthipeptide [Streptomyces sp. NPDC093111]
MSVLKLQNLRPRTIEGKGIAVSVTSSYSDCCNKDPQ